MILTVSHVTTYRYDAPMRGAVQSLRLFPSRHDGQKVLDWEVAVEGGIRGGGFRDGAGDRVEGWSVRGPLTEVRVTVAGRIETLDTAGVLRGHRESVRPFAYLRETTPTRTDRALDELVAEVRGGAVDALDTAHRLCDRLSEAIAYRPGTTSPRTTAAEAYAQGEGVCQDHAHAMIACARAAGLPARYVSGYLFGDGADGGAEAGAADAPSQTQAQGGGMQSQGAVLAPAPLAAAAPGEEAGFEAAHAWAEVFIAGLGWVGFDPANACCPDARYIRLGSGFDAQDAAPIRGMAQGPGSEKLDVAVAVDLAQQ